jgi:hypothetical protein
MTIVEFSRPIATAKARLFNVLADVDTWEKWDPDLAKATITSRPSPDTLLGLKGHLVMKFKAEFDFEITAADPEGYVAYQTNHLGAKMVWYWDFKQEESPGNLVLKEGVEITGALSSVYNWVLGKRCYKAFEEATLNLKNICEAPQ